MIDLPTTPIGLDDLPGPLRARVEAELVEGERLLWAGRSGSRPGSAMPASIPWWITGLIGVGICFGAIGVGAGLIHVDRFNGLAVPIGCLAGLVAYVTLALAIGASYRRRINRNWPGRALYALTDRRAILWAPQPVEGSGAIAVITVEPGEELNVSRIDYPEGTSVVSLGTLSKGMHGISWHFPLEFVGIDQARRVERLARQVLGRRNPPDRSALGHS